MVIYILIGVIIGFAYLVIGALVDLWVGVDGCILINMLFWPLVLFITMAWYTADWILDLYKKARRD